MNYRFASTIRICLGLAASSTALLQAAGVVTQCNEDNLLAALAGGGRVTFSCSGTIVVTMPISVSVDTTIDANGQAVTISGGGSVAIFVVPPAVSLSLHSIVLARGNSAVFGGAINSLGTVVISDSTLIDNNAGFLGGAIFNVGALTVTNSTFSGNSAMLSGGGAILNDGTAVITGSTFSRNSANSGGAIDNSSGTLSAVNSTFFDNSASDIGGAILNDNTTAIINCTMANNDAVFGGGIDNNFGSVLLENTIISGSEGGNCTGDVSGAGNLSSDSSCPGIQNTNPRLGPLQYNGGPSDTMALLAGSPAIDTAIESYCAATDQRGVPRPQGRGCDIGAYERASVPASGDRCITFYNDTFSGNVNVSPGQNCGFVSGGVTGNVMMHGGNLILSQANVTGNVQIDGGGHFFITGATRIGNDLQIQNIPAGSGQNEICGLSLRGNLQIHNNGVAINVGSTASTCAGNAIGNDLQIQNNTAETVIAGNQVSGNLQDQNNTGFTEVINNIVKNNLQCQGNGEIIGGPNTAKQKQGQCY